MLYDQGDMVDLPCELCPDLMVGTLDRRSGLTMRLLNALGNLPSPEMTPPWEALWTICGIHDLETLQEVWERLGIYRLVMDEHRKLTQGETPIMGES
jgi:hypothetical protein